MTGSIAARRYARALFNLGSKHGLPELEKTAQDLAALRAEILASADLARLFKAPVFSSEEKSRVAAKLLDKRNAGALTKRFCLLLAEKERLALLPDIAAVYSELLDAERGLLRGELVTAVPLSEEKRRVVLAELGKRSKQNMELNCTVNPAILGGVLLKVGDRVLDGSLRAQLESLKGSIRAGQ